MPLLDRIAFHGGSIQRVGRPDNRLLKHRRHLERNKDVVENPHDDGVVAGGVGDGDGLLGQGPATCECTPVGEL